MAEMSLELWFPESCSGILFILEIPGYPSYTKINVNLLMINIYITLYI